MKIHDQLPNVKIQKGTADEPAKLNGPAFQSLLDSQLQEVSESSAVQSPAGVTPAQATPAHLRFEGLTTTESVISTLDSYGTALADSRWTPSDLEPFVTSLESDTSALLAIKDQLAADDPLRRLLDRVSAMAYLETVKYRRGDYDA